MLISTEYLALQRRLHAQGSYGISSGRWVAAVRDVRERFCCDDILDYGCGQGRLRAAIPDVTEYDPAIAGKDAEPAPADLVVCTDVLEHVEPENLDDVLRHLRSKTRKRLFFNIALRPAIKVLADGRNAHLIVESAAWWLDRLAPYFRVLEHTIADGFELSGIAQPVSIVGDIKSVGVLREERNAHTRVNVLKTPKRIPDHPVPAHAGQALIVCYGPSLRSSWSALAQQRKASGTVLVSVSGAHDFLRQRRITPDLHVECDPRPHKRAMLAKLARETKYLMASCCHPEVIDHVAGHDLTLWHLYNGPESYDIRAIKSEEAGALIPGGGSVGLRTITLLYFLGYRNFVIHGMDCSFDGAAQHAGAHSGKLLAPMQVNPAVKIGAAHVTSERWFTTAPVLVTYAQHMLRDLRLGRYPGCSFYWYGDGLFQEMLRLQNLQLQSLAEEAAARGETPAYVEPSDYFHLNAGDGTRIDQGELA